MLTVTIQQKMTIVSSFTQHVFPMCEHKICFIFVQQMHTVKHQKEQPFVTVCFLLHTNTVAA